MQLEIENKVFAIVQPRRIAAHLLSRCFSIGHRAAGGQEPLRHDLFQSRQRRRAESRLKVGPGIGQKETADDSHATGVGALKWLQQRGQPIGAEAHAGVGGGNDLARRSGNGRGAPLRDVGPRTREHPQGQSALGGALFKDGDGIIGRAAVHDDHLVGRAGLGGQRIQQAADALALVEHRGNDRDFHRSPRTSWSNCWKKATM